MTAPPFQLIALDERDRSGFASGVEPLDRYFRAQVGQDVRRRIAAAYVAVEGASGIIAGFYTLSAADVLLAELPPEMTRRLPRYPTLPAARLGRLAVDARFRGRGLGAALLADAARRAAGSEVAVFAMVVDAKDEAAAAFYRHHGFQGYGSASGKMVAPIASLWPPR